MCLAQRKSLQELLFYVPSWQFSSTLLNHLVSFKDVVKNSYGCISSIHNIACGKSTELPIGIIILAKGGFCAGRYVASMRKCMLMLIDV